MNSKFGVLVLLSVLIALPAFAEGDANPTGFFKKNDASTIFPYERSEDPEKSKEDYEHELEERSSALRQTYLELMERTQKKIAEDTTFAIDSDESNSFGHFNGAPPTGRPRGPRRD